MQFRTKLLGLSLNSPQYLCPRDSRVAAKGILVEVSVWQNELVSLHTTQRVVISLHTTQRVVIVYLFSVYFVCMPQPTNAVHNY